MRRLSQEKADTKKNIYQKPRSVLYRTGLLQPKAAAGLTEEEIGRLLVLDIKDADYFRAGGALSQHGGGNLFAGDPEIMGWLFGQ